MSTVTVPTKGRVRRLAERIAGTKAGAWWFINVASRIDPIALRATNGRLSFTIGAPVLLLTHTGARSGATRRTPLLYALDGDDIVLVASKGGNARHPAWFHNLRARPEVHLTVKGRSGRYIAREAQGEERERLWALANDVYGGYATYQRRTGGRRIPVMVLRRS